jgi:blue copper oxidase
MEERKFALKNKTMSRRDFLRLLGWGTLGTAASGWVGSILAGCSSDTRASEGPAYQTGTISTQNVDLELRLRVEPGEVQILSGQPTAIWHYQGEVIAGDTNALQSLPGSYLGPIIRVSKGQRVRVHLENHVDEQTIIHWHGLLVPPEMDGHPRDVIQPGEKYLYEFEIRNRAGTYWFHPHPHTLTGPQVYRGLAGLFLVSDEEETAAGLPSKEYDLPLVIQDRSFDRNNQLVYLRNGRMDRMMGFLGDHILVNGQPDFRLSAARQPYRLRLLNGSNSRIYKLAWDDSTPLTIIGTDVGLLEKPVQRDYVTLGPAERVELWVDFANWPLGENLQLVSLPFSGASIDGMMGPGGMSRGTLLNGSHFPVLTVKVDRDAVGTSSLSEQLSTLARYHESDSINAAQPRSYRLGMGGMGGRMGRGGGMIWTINGRVFEMEEVARDEIVQMNTQETWLFDNSGTGGGMGMMGNMMQLAHPMHVHGVHFQIIDRQVLPAFEEGWESVSPGYVDEGWKDTVLVMPGEQVKILMRFQDFPGMYLYHCHNLEHEDMGMMRNFRIDA